MKLRQFVTAVLATSLTILFSSSPAWAGINPQPFRTGLFGVTAGQTIRISVVNAGIIEPCAMPEVLVSAVRLRNLEGTPLFESKGELLREGVGTFVDIPWEEPATTVTRIRRRAQIRAEVELLFDDTLLQRGDLLLTLEVFDTLTGRTAFTVAFNPQPEPPEPIRTDGAQP
jgi:hypothetical protein